MLVRQKTVTRPAPIVGRCLGLLLLACSQKAAPGIEELGCRWQEPCEREAIVRDVRGVLVGQPVADVLMHLGPPDCSRYAPCEEFLESLSEGAFAYYVGQRGFFPLCLIVEASDGVVRATSLEAFGL